MGRQGRVLNTAGPSGPSGFDSRLRHHTWSVNPRRSESSATRPLGPMTCPEADLGDAGPVRRCRRVGHSRHVIGHDHTDHVVADDAASGRTDPCDQPSREALVAIHAGQHDRVTGGEVSHAPREALRGALAALGEGRGRKRWGDGETRWQGQEEGNRRRHRARRSRHRPRSVWCRMVRSGAVGSATQRRQAITI